MPTGTVEPCPIVSERDPSVLIVDDDESIREMCQTYIEKVGYDVRTAANGGEALVKLEQSVDVVVLDRRMPGMSGDEVLDHITEWNECRIVMMTAVDPDPAIIEKGVDDYLTKPVTGNEVLEAIEQSVLFEAYEQLLSEYYATSRTYATIKSNFQTSANEGTVADLKAKREELRSELHEIVSAFDNDEILEVVEEFRPATAPIE